MICIDKYFEDKLHFTCTDCNQRVGLKFDKPVENNSVAAIKVECPYCGDVGTLLVLRCKDEYMAKSLLGKFQELNEKYRGGD